jgi:predicted RNA-binding Zn ribbon-like protein
MPGMKFIGGRVCLDFVNTVGARVSGQRDKRFRDYADSVLREKLNNYQDLLTWGQLAGLATKDEVRRLGHMAERHPQDAARTLARAKRLREALYRIFKSLLEGWPLDDADVDLLRQELSIAKTHERLRRSGTRFAWAWEQSEDALDGALWRVSQSAADLLTSSDPGQLRQCSGDECGWMFLDTSRNRGRRWCDMKDCGNRAKVRQFRQRQEQGGRHK